MAGYPILLSRSLRKRVGTLISSRTRKTPTLVAARGKHRMLRRRHGRRALLILPQHPIQPGRAVGVGTREVHLRRELSSRSFAPVSFVDESIVQIPMIGLESRLIAGARKQTAHYRSISVVLIHRRKPKQHFHSVDHIHSGVEPVLHIRLGRRTR